MKTNVRMIMATMTVALAGLAAQPAQANLIEAASWNGGGTQSNYSKAIGWQFEVNTDMYVTHLGVLDLGDTGLNDEHTVGIFDSDGELVVSTTIGAGLSGDLMAGSMIYDTVAITALSKGESYYILADNWSNDDYAWGNSAVSFSDDIDWLNFSESTTSSIFDSVQHFEGENGNLGPGFMYRPAPAPGALALLALAGCCSTRRRRTT